MSRMHPEHPPTTPGGNTAAWADRRSRQNRHNVRVQRRRAVVAGVRGRLCGAELMSLQSCSYVLLYPVNPGVNVSTRIVRALHEDALLNVPTELSWARNEVRGDSYRCIPLWTISAGTSVGVVGFSRHQCCVRLHSRWRRHFPLWVNGTSDLSTKLPVACCRLSHKLTDHSDTWSTAVLAISIVRSFGRAYRVT